MKPSITVWLKKQTNKENKKQYCQGLVFINDPGILQVGAEDQEFVVSLDYIVVQRLASIM